MYNIQIDEANVVNPALPAFLHFHPARLQIKGGNEKSKQLTGNTYIDHTLTVGVLPSGSPRGIPRRVVMSRDSPRLECDGARNTKI